MIEKEIEGEIQISKKVYKKEERKGMRRTYKQNWRILQLMKEAKKNVFEKKLLG